MPRASHLNDGYAPSWSGHRSKDNNLPLESVCRIYVYVPIGWCTAVFLLARLFLGDLLGRDEVCAQRFGRDEKQR